MKRRDYNSLVDFRIKFVRQHLAWKLPTSIKILVEIRQVLLEIKLVDR